MRFQSVKVVFKFFWRSIDAALGLRPNTAGEFKPLLFFGREL